MLLQPTVEGLQQGYCVIPSEKRFLVLYTFLRKMQVMKQKVKVMVFFSSCSSVKFHAELLNFLGIECYDIHGQLKQQKRTTTFFRFPRRKRASCYALTWQHVGLIFLMWTTLCNSILQMTQRTTFTESVVLPEVIKAKDVHCCSYYQKK